MDYLKAELAKEEVVKIGIYTSYGTLVHKYEKEQVEFIFLDDGLVVIDSKQPKKTMIGYPLHTIAMINTYINK